MTKQELALAGHLCAQLQWHSWRKVVRARPWQEHATVFLPRAGCQGGSARAGEEQQSLNCLTKHFWHMQCSGFEPVQGMVTLVRLRVVSIEQA